MYIFNVDPGKTGQQPGYETSVKKLLTSSSSMTKLQQEIAHARLGSQSMYDNRCQTTWPAVKVANPADMHKSVHV